MDTATTVRLLLRPISITPSPPPPSCHQHASARERMDFNRCWLISVTLTMSQVALMTVESEVDLERQGARIGQFKDRKEGRQTEGERREGENRS